MLSPEQTRRLEEARQRQRNQQLQNARVARASFMTWLREVSQEDARAIALLQEWAAEGCDRKVEEHHALDARLRRLIEAPERA